MHPVAAGELKRWTVDQQAGADRRSPARKHGQSPQDVELCNRSDIRNTVVSNFADEMACRLNPAMTPTLSSALSPGTTPTTPGW
jgi:hypothetical protein